ncbi:MAG: hypothetical protein K8T89_05285 [Planctomycetes bacterium]|nr:hypothetical protein [Planctomycetota bacterium]
MCRLSCGVLVLFVGISWFTVVAAEPTAEEAKLAELRKKPITMTKGELGDLLTKWWKEGTAAGNVGDFYDNRDGAHSDLNTQPYPQLQRIVYTEDDIKTRRNWALTLFTRPHVTFGNSSTSAPPTAGGSNPRHAYSSSRGLSMLSQQYKGNNVYMYPEHRDHDPGHNGVGEGFGDLYPTNTPYMLVSQGSSGSDQPFMRAVPYTLAAFRPDVKQKLIESGLLMPTLQMILRSTNKHLTDPKEYLTGKAHPTVFEGSSVEPVKMVKLAHEITTETIPPMVQIKVVEQDTPENGRDYFEPRGLTEKLGDTPEVIARIWRGKDERRRMVVSAVDSYDLNKKPLTFTWVVLRGDEKRIQITPKNKVGSEAEIVVKYQPRRPISTGSTMESNRVDIGVFVHNGTYHSAPAFVTFCTLDNESRAYDDKGRILEIGYGAGEVDMRVSNHPALFEALIAADGLPAHIFKLTAEQRGALEKARQEDATLRASLDQARKQQKDAENARALMEKELKETQDRLAKERKDGPKNPTTEMKAELEKMMKKEAEDAANARKSRDDAVKAAQKSVQEAEKKLDDFLAAKRSDLKESVNDFVRRTLPQARQDPTLFDSHEKIFRAAIEKATPARKNAIEVARQRLIQMGLATNREGGRLEWQPIRLGSTQLEQRLTRFEKQLIERFNATLITELVLPGVLTVSSSPNFVDFRMGAPKSWRDVYHYDPAGKLTGWTRYDGKTATDFTEEGMMVLAKDNENRPIKAQTVRYQQTPIKNPGQPSPLVASPGEEIVTYAYEGDKRVEKSRTGATKE